MNKREKILIAILLTSFCLLAYIFAHSSQSPAQPKEMPSIAEEQKPMPAVDRTVLANDYKKAAVLINRDVVEAVTVIADSKSNEGSRSEASTTLSTAKSKLMNIRVPADLRNLHIEMVMAVDKALSYLNHGGKKELAESQDRLKRASSDYAWLNTYE